MLPRGSSSHQDLLGLRTVLPGLILSALAAAGPVAPTSTATGGLFEGKPRVAATLVSDVTQVEPGGAFRLGVQLQMARGWYVYWKNPGEAGLATEVVWDAPRTSVEPLRWPAPEVHRSPDGSITSYGYSGQVVLFAPARASPDVDRPLTVVGTAEVLVCATQCIPARLEVTRLDVRTGGAGRQFGAPRSRAPFQATAPAG